MPVRRWAFVVVIVGFACALSAPVRSQAPVSSETTAPTLRIPPGARPTRYALELTIVPGAAKVSGEITIDLALDRPHPVLWLNAVAVSISKVVVDAADSDARVITDHDQFVGLAFDPPLAAGSHRLRLAFEAEQNRNSSRGIFTLQDNGAWYTMTQFEPIAARQAFPCFDEPGFKAPWQVTLRVPRELIAVSNAPVVSDTDTGDGMRSVRFAPTQPLPSYLVAFAVGPWQIADLGRAGSASTPLRLIAPRGQASQLAFAARAFPELFALEERWFDIAYPFAKLDQIAIPLNVRFAMENVGLITYGAPLLLQPGAAAPPPFRHTLVNVGAHEMAHQWFGNLVTPAWWDDVWLNESFATWFAEKIVDAWRPGYEHGGERVEARAYAIEADALRSARRIREPIVARGDIFNAFDPITYGKGATVIGMFEGWLGEAAFRRGVQGYLRAHRHGSATVTDFLAALSAQSGQAIAPAFATFLDQNGVPQVGVELDCSSKRPRLELTQRRHVPYASEPGAQRWQIPVCVRYGSPASAREACTLVTGATATVDLHGGCPTFVFGNAGGRGYYIADYHGGLLARLKSQRRALTPAEQASVLYDLRPLVRAGSVHAGDALEWIRGGARSRDRNVMVAAIALASFVRDTLVTDADRKSYSAFVRQVFGPRARALGFVPRTGESDDDQLLRGALLRFAAPEDPGLARQGRRLAVAWIRDRKAIDPGLVDVVLAGAATTGDAALFDAMFREVHKTADRLDRRNLMIALFSFADPGLARRGLGLLLDPAIDVREAMTALGQARESSRPSRAPYDFLAAHFDALAGRVDRDAPAGWSRYAAHFCTRQDREAVAEFWRARSVRYAGAERVLAQTLESIDACTALRAREARSAGAFLAQYH
jgi:cytosol alanyl aminopeptidase